MFSMGAPSLRTLELGAAQPSGAVRRMRTLEAAMDIAKNQLAPWTCRIPHMAQSLFKMISWMANYKTAESNHGIPAKRHVG